MCFVDRVRLLRKNIMPFTSFVEQLWAPVEVNSISEWSIYLCRVINPDYYLYSSPK